MLQPEGIPAEVSRNYRAVREVRALWVGFEARLCPLYRAQTKGKVESEVKYVRRNMWPSLRFTDDADLNQQALE